MFALFECCFVFIWFIYMLIKFLHFLVYFLFAFGQSIQLIAAFINTITNKISLSMLCLVCNVCFPSFRVVLLKITFLALSIFCIVLFHFLSALFSVRFTLILIICSHHIDRNVCIMFCTHLTTVRTKSFLTRTPYTRL